MAIFESSKGVRMNFKARIAMGISAGVAAHSNAAQAAIRCTEMIDATSGKRLVHEGQCDERITPASTFKIAISLMGYDSGILIDDWLNPQAEMAIRFCYSAGSNRPRPVVRQRMQSGCLNRCERAAHPRSLRGDSPFGRHAVQALFWARVDERGRSSRESTASDTRRIFWRGT